MSFSPELRLGDLTKFSSKYKGMRAAAIVCQCHSETFVGNLSVNDGRIGTYIEEEHIFITTPNNTFIPHPPTTRQVHLYEDGHLDITTPLVFLNFSMKDFATFLSFLVNQPFTM